MKKLFLRRLIQICQVAVNPASFLGPLRSWIVALLILGSGVFALPLAAQAVDPNNRLISEVTFDGVQNVDEQLLRNVVRTQAGQGYDAALVQDDVVRLNSLGRFGIVLSSFEDVGDGTVRVVFTVDELPLLTDVQVIGNKAKPDQELLAVVVLRSGDARDNALIERGRREMISFYEADGFFAADVTVNEDLLEETGILVYQVREGPKVRIRGISYEGNDKFEDKQLRTNVRSKTYQFILRKGELSREALDLDAARIREFYQNRGYLDARVGRRIDLAPNQRDATVAFLIEEGNLYTVEDVTVEGNTVFPEDQIRLYMPLKEGDVFSEKKLQDSEEAIRDLYGRLGYMESRVRIDRLYSETKPSVTMQVNILEGVSSVVGNVNIVGNHLTKDRVVLRQVRGAEPGRRFDRVKLDQTRRQVQGSGLFSDSSITLLGEADDPVRDVLVQVKETNTGSISFGAGISSDSGIVGAIDLTQRNFDIADVPANFKEFSSGRSFRGAGQRFNLTLQPGNENSRYAIGITEPHLFDSDISLGTQLFFTDRERDDYNERRFGGTASLGRRFGDVWSASVNARIEQVRIEDVAATSTQDVVDQLGENLLTSLGIRAVRSTVDSRFAPTRGSRLEVGLRRYGALGGDFDFTRIDAEFKKWWTIDEDFLGRKTTLLWGVEVGYIIEENESPVFERFYAGGHRTFRGFEFRGIGPRGFLPSPPNAANTLSEEAVGGDWMLLTKLEYNYPILEDFMRGVFFTDMGTITNDPGFEDWRISVGAGVRLQLPFFGQAPFALDVAIPLKEQETDEDQLVSFDLAVPF